LKILDWIWIAKYASPLISAAETKSGLELSEWLMGYAEIAVLKSQS